MCGEVAHDFDYSLIFGGGHERGYRSGTLVVPYRRNGKVGRTCEERLENGEVERIAALRDELWHTLQQTISGLDLNGHSSQRLCSTLNFSVQQVEAQALMMALRDVALSSGSACSSASLEPSYVLRAMGIEADRAHASIRVGIGRFTTAEEIATAAIRFKKQSTN